MYFKCWVCEKTMPIAVKEDHHSHLQAAGGEDSETYSLCSGCHDNVHKVAVLISGPKASTANDVSKQLYPNAEQRHKFHELVKQAVISKKMKDLGLLDEEKKSKLRFKLMLSFDPKVRAQLSLLAKERGLSMQTYAEKVLLSHLNTRFPTDT